MEGKHPMNEPLKTLVSRAKKQAGVLAETIQFELWQRCHGKAFREKNKHSRLVHPDVDRDASPRKPEQPEPHWTEEELQEIAQNLRSKSEEYARLRSQAEKKP